jgi:hypothetical protein
MIQLVNDVDIAGETSSKSSIMSTRPTHIMWTSRDVSQAVDMVSSGLNRPIIIAADPRLFLV